MRPKTLTHRETAYICRNLSGLLHAGIPVYESCFLLSQEETGSTGLLLEQLGTLLDQGLSLADALEQLQCFPASTVGMVRTGEYAGQLEEALLSAAQFHETRERTARQLRNALGYPVMLLLLMLTVVVVLLVQVLPVFDSVYASLGTRLTGLAAGLLQLGQWLKQLLPLLLGLLGILAGSAAAWKLFPGFRNALSTRFYKFSDDRGLRRKFNNALFAQALAMGIGSGLTPEDTITLAATLLADSPAAAARCSQSLALIREGSSLSEAFTEACLMPPYACRMLSIGLRGGNADQILADVAARMLEDAEQALADRIAKIEPSIVLAASILVGIILLSVMLPLLNIMSALR